MTPIDPERQSEALDAYLHGQIPADHPELPKYEAELAAELKSAAQQIQPPAKFETELERALMQEARRKHSGLRRSLSGAGRTIAWAALAILLMLGFSWVFRTLLPSTAPGTGPTDNVLLTPSHPTIAETSQATETRNPGQPTPTAAAEANITTYSLPMFPGVKFELKAELPEAPDQVNIYQQKPWPMLTPESALQLARQLGVDGQLYKAPFGPPVATSYLVSDGYAKVAVQQAMPWFTYYSTSGDNVSISNSLPPEQALAIGEEFLKSHGLAIFEYQPETVAESPGEVQFVQTLDGIPVLYSHYDASKVRVQMVDTGQVTEVDSNLGNFVTLGSYPILTAQEAWEKVLSPETASGLESSEISKIPGSRLTWQRAYPLNTTVELFGYAQSYPAVNPNLPPLVFFKDYPTGGNTQGLAVAAENNRFLQAWGQFNEDNQGRRRFDLDGWQASRFPEQGLEGTIERQDGRSYLVTIDQRLLLPEAPDDLPTDKIISATGVILSEPEPTLEWSILHLGPLGGGGGGGGSAFLELNLEGPRVTPVEPAALEPTPTPLVKLGSRIDGAEGKAMVFINRYLDGSSQVKVMFSIEDSPEWPGGLVEWLDGPGLAGIEAYHNLPVRVWGEVTDSSGLLPVMTIERFEPAYPGEKIQAWIGLMEGVTVEGQQVLLFTTQDGEKFVLKTSIDSPGPDALLGNPGDPLVVEGFLVPGQTLGGYPVVTDYATLPMPGTGDLTDYQPMSAKPLVTSKEGTAGERRIGSIDKIELVYQTDDPRYLQPTVDVAPVYAQPAWRFSGKYDDGSSFMILVQALRPEFLK
jgi:hypothetical protein